MAKTIKAKKIMPDENEVTRDVHAEPKISNRFSNYKRSTETFNDMGLTQGKLARSRKERTSTNESDIENIVVRREESTFKHLFKMLIGQSLLPDFDQYANKKLSTGQKKKIARWEEYFKKIQNMTYYGVMNNEGDRRLRYMEYDRMEWMTPEVGRALDVLAADATIKNENNDTLTIVTENQQLKEELEKLFYDILDLNSQAFWMVRDMIKYGDSFWTNHIDTKYGMRKLLPAPVEQCEREVGYDETNPLAYRFRIAGMGSEYLMPYEVSHFRLKSSVDFGEYGKSVLENGRRIWRQLITIEDSMLIYRLVRAPERRLFYFDVGNLNPAEVENAVNRFTAMMKKDRIFDDNGNIDYRMGLNPIHKDSLIPLLDNRVITIENLSKEIEEGKENWVYSIDDKTHELKPGKVVWCGKNFSDAEILKVELDDGSYILSHPTHPFILRDGSHILAADLKENQSLMPFYSSIDKKGYERVYNPATNRKKGSRTFVSQSIHKVKSVSIWNEMSDVYCMSVVGPNEENDRHNFAVLPFNMKTTNKWNRYSGIYISNSVDEDIVIPTRGEKNSTKIETLPSQQWSAIDDVKYIQQKFITSLGVPNAYLGYEEALNSKATLGNEDIRYAKYVERIQSAFLETLYDIALIHLYLKGYKTNDLKEFELHLSNPSHINELQELEIIQARLDLYNNAKDSGAFSTYYLYKNVLKLSDDEIEEEEGLKLRDGIYQFCIQNAQSGTFLTVKDVLDFNKKQGAAAQDALGGDIGGGGGGGFGDDLGGDIGGFGGEQDFSDMSAEEVTNETGIEPPDLSGGLTEEPTDNAEEVL